LYPFGLKHKGYNNVVNGIENNYKTYQGQELTEDLELNVIEFKYRFHDPAIGRFWQIDPLADIYVYNSPYAFAENKLGLGIELEGLEIIPTYGMEYANAKTSQDYEQIKIGKQAAAAGVTAGIAAWVIPAVVSVVGVRASATAVANEAKDEVLSRVTDGASDVLDLSKMAFKGLKNLAEFGAKKLFGKADDVVGVADDIVDTASGIDSNTLNHVFGKEEHNLGGLLDEFGGSQTDAFGAVQDAANKALKDGKLTTNSKGILPSGDNGIIVNVAGQDVRLIGGRVIDGKVEISSFSQKDLN
jgi:RHS repeat-associated protein